MGRTSRRTRCLHRVVAVIALTAVVFALAPPSRAIDPLPPNLVPIKIELDAGLIPAFADPLGGTVIFLPRGNGDPAVPPPLQGIRIDGQGAPVLSSTSGDPERIKYGIFIESSGEGKSVAEYTDQLAALLKVDPVKNAPPKCFVVWPDGFRFKCVLEFFSLRFTLFLDDGTPVRAVMDCTFKEYTPAQEQMRGHPHG